MAFVYGAIGLELGVRQSSGLVANFYKADRAIHDGIRQSSRDAGALTKEITQQLSRVKTGFMRAHVTLRESPMGLVWEVGWDVVDFVDAGLPFYPVFQELGTRTISPMYALQAAHRYVSEIFGEQLRATIRDAIEGLDTK